MENKRLRKLWDELKKETLSRTGTHQIALGIGTGVFLGIFPVQGFKTAIAALICTLSKKINFIALFTASTVFSLIPLVPFVYFFDYWVGTKILGVPVLFTIESFKNFNIRMLGDSVGALFIGGAFIGIVMGIISYFLSFLVLKLKNKRMGKI